jgi:hypothetical protein
LFSYQTPAPHEYFNTDGTLKAPAEQTAQELREKIRSTCELLQGGERRGERWLRDDELFHYDFQQFESVLTEQISYETSMTEFYHLFDETLQTCRQNGEDTKLSVFEVEQAHRPAYATKLLSTFQNANIFVVLRNPTQQYRSLKADILTRGPQTADYHGALSTRRNLFGEYVESLQSSMSSACRVSHPRVTCVNFDNLREVTEDDAEMIAADVLDEQPGIDSLKTHIMNISRPNQPLENQYVSLSAESQSAFHRWGQEHLPISFERDEWEKFMHTWEQMFAEVHRDLQTMALNSESESSTTFLLSMLRILSLVPIGTIRGVKEVRESMKLRHRCMLRLNAHRVLLSTILWMVADRQYLTQKSTDDS